MPGVDHEGRLQVLIRRVCVIVRREHQLLEPRVGPALGPFADDDGHDAHGDRLMDDADVLVRRCVQQGGAPHALHLQLVRQPLHQQSCGGIDDHLQLGVAVLGLDGVAQAGLRLDLERCAAHPDGLRQALEVGVWRREQAVCPCHVCVQQHVGAGRVQHQLGEVQLGSVLARGRPSVQLHYYAVGRAADVGAHIGVTADGPMLWWRVLLQVRLQQLHQTLAAAASDVARAVEQRRQAGQRVVAVL